MISSTRPVEIREYIDLEGKSPYGRWFNKLNAIAAAKIAVVVEKIAAGNFSNIEPVGEGVSEYRLDWGPGYRIYFGQDGKALIILVGGGTKKRQGADIRSAKQAWADYKKRKREERKR